MSKNYKITWYERYRLHKIADRIVIQSHEHQRNIIEYFKILNKAAGEQFREDNKATLNSFLRECFENSLP